MTVDLPTLLASGMVKEGTVRLARHLGFLYGEDRDPVIMAVACAITALEAGSVCFDLARADQLHCESDPPPRFDWPDPQQWAQLLASSELVSVDPAARDRPVVLDRQAVYLTRYWAEQQKIVDLLSRRLRSQPVPPAGLAASLDLFFGAEPSPQRAAAEQAATRSFCVVAGGPGTGKTTVVARILATLATSRTNHLRVILTAPTGRAAARLEQAVRENLAACQALCPQPIDIRCTSGTLHRILGLKPWGACDHDAAHPLAADMVVVDEASMLSLHLMTLLLDAIPDQTRLVLLGDADQLASVEAGAVLADKGYDADYIAEAVSAMGAQVVIPPRSNRKAPRELDSHLYRERNAIERMFGKMKHFRGIATRYGKSALSFMAFLHLAAILLWLK